MSVSRDVADYRCLDAHFDGQIVTHTRYRSNPSTGERRVRYEEKWRRGPYLGHGSWATVLLEENVKTQGKLRAVKIISKLQVCSTNVDPIDEAVVMSILSHEQNVGLFVNFYGYYETRNELCIVMEYVRHGDLDHHLYEYGPLQDSDASIIVKQLLEGLEVIHKLGFIHRDLKPGNILIQQVSPWWVKISDFGISKRLINESAVTFTGRGTSGYKAPEISFGERTRHTTAVDMWSLGCVTHKSLTGKVPFENDRQILRFCADPRPFYAEFDSMNLISEYAKSFIKELIVKPPQKRASAIQAMQFAWIIQTPHAVSQPMISQISQNNEASNTSLALSPHDTLQVPTTMQPVEIMDQSSLSLSTSNTLSIIYPRNLAWKLRLPITHKQPRDALVLKRKTYSNDNNEAFQQAIACSDLDVVQLLLDKGAINLERNNLNGWKPLIWAAKVGSEEAVRILLARGASIDSKDAFGMAALHTAVIEGHTHVVETLLDEGGDVDLQCYRGWTPLLYAAQTGDAGIVQMLLERGANLNAENDKGWTALHIAAHYGHKRAIRILLRNELQSRRHHP